MTARRADPTFFDISDGFMYSKLQGTVHCSGLKEEFICLRKVRVKRLQVENSIENCKRLRRCRRNKRRVSLFL
jgi:hypothetical protein